MRLWVASNIEGWIEDKPDWFRIKMIPDDFLPRGLLEAEGGAQRRRSSVSMRELVAFEQAVRSEQTTVRTHRGTSRTTRQSKEAWKKMAEEIYEARSKKFEENASSVKKTFNDDEEQFRPLLERCPAFETILAHILLNKLGFRAQEVDITSEMIDWKEEDCRRVGHSFAFFLRKRKAGEVAVDTWRKQYPQLEVLFEEVIGFETFVVTLANSLLKDSIYGTVY